MKAAHYFTTLALSFPNTESHPHFNRTGFAVTGKRLFATYLEKDNSCNIFLSPREQALFCKIDKQHIYPVPNKWGEKGATTFLLDKLDKTIVQEALLSAYNGAVQPKKKSVPHRKD